MEVVHENVGFGYAFEVMKVNPQKIGMRLSHWKEDVIIKIESPTLGSRMTAPFLYVDSRFGKVPWKENMIELFSNEWQIVKLD